uniref:Uncharacterized protein n=1 Tax=Anguilla anguilla TaxID=7936 RepID=A0A0E9WNM0_ANGAN
MIMVHCYSALGFLSNLNIVFVINFASLLANLWGFCGFSWSSLASRSSALHGDAGGSVFPWGRKHFTAV